MAKLGSPILNQRYNFALKHMMAAARFCRHCYKVEQDNMGKLTGSFFDEVQSYVSATVFSTVASLEANINESFADVQDGLVVIDGFKIQVLQDSWNDIENSRILEKYDTFLEWAGKDRLNKGVRNYQSVKIIIGVRNALVHYKPEWHTQQKKHRKIGNQLHGKFELSPFTNENDPVFPMRCMTFGFAQWTVQSGLDFAEWFSGFAGIPNRYEKFSDRLHTTPK